MYGVVAGQKGGGKARAGHREQNGEEKVKKFSVTEKLMEYVKRRLSPQADGHMSPLDTRGMQQAILKHACSEQAGGCYRPLETEEECEESVLAGVPVRHRPEPPGTLALTTRFTAHEIKLMYRGFKQECPSGEVDEEAFKHIFSQFFPLGDATQYAHFVFKTIKHKQSGKVNFEEFLDILSRVARGSVQEKLSWVFALYDVDGDGRISRAEMLSVVQAIYELLGRAAVPPVHSTAAKDHVDRIFHLMDTNCDGVVTPDELARWCSRDPALLRSLDTLDTVL